MPVRSFFKSVRGYGYLLHTLMLVVGIRLGLTFLSYKRLRTVLPRFIKPQPTPPDPHADRGNVRTVVQAVSKVSRIVPGASCLTQAIATQFMLARQGRATRLHIGVMKDNQGAFKAHAWVIWDGAVIIGGDVGDYKNIAAFDLLKSEPQGD